LSVIKAKTSFRGVCECKHTPFRPLKNDIAFLQRPLTPFPVMLWMSKSMSRMMMMMMMRVMLVDTWEEMQPSMPCHLHHL